MKPPPRQHRGQHRTRPHLVICKLKGAEARYDSNEWSSHGNASTSSVWKSPSGTLDAAIRISSSDASIPATLAPRSAAIRAKRFERLLELPRGAAALTSGMAGTAAGRPHDPPRGAQIGSTSRSGPLPRAASSDAGPPLRRERAALQVGRRGRSLGDCRVVVMPGQQHAAMDTGTELFASEVLLFLETV